MVLRSHRWTLGNILPVVFVTWVLTSVWLLHGWLHLLPLLQLNVPDAMLDVGMRQRGIIQTVISQPLILLLLICFIRAIMTNPGNVPQTAEWQAELQRGKKRFGRASGGQDREEEEQLLPAVHEVKQTGGRRFCKWCNAYKPDRCHHCRVCKTCVLRMDHHCPWIANCVGFRNHKYFFLLVFYAASSCLVVVGTMVEAVSRSLIEEMPSMERFLIVFSMTMAGIMGSLLGCFFCLHICLMLHATTTIEFCEKRHRHYGSQAGKIPSYDRGTYENIRAVLGPNPLLWFLPVCPPLGDGLSFPLNGESEEAEPERVTRTGSRAMSDDEDSDKESTNAGTPAPEVTGARAAAV